MADKDKTTITTINVSKSFARMVTAIANEGGESVREWCDRELAPALRTRAKKAIKRIERKKLESIDLGGEGWPR